MIPSSERVEVFQKKVDLGDFDRDRLALPVVHNDFLSVVSAHSTVAAGGEVASLPTESPALCTTCDIRLDDTSIRACSIRSCPHVQQEAA